jgi:signal recognition particle GTPase
MTQITIDIPNETDTNWVVQLLNRLQLEYKIDNLQTNKKLSEEELKKNQAIIAKGSSMTMEEANEMLEWVKEQRQDRPLPFRD